MISAIVTRLEASIPALQGRIRQAAEFQALMESNSLKGANSGLYVLPTGLRGGQAEAVTGAFVQSIEEMVAVVVFLPSHDKAGAAKLGLIQDLTRQVITAIAGWEPENTIGPFRLLRGAMLNVGAGALVYQIDFALTDQLRITT